MNRIEIFVRVTDKEPLVNIELVQVNNPGAENGFFWESRGEYRLEVYQCKNFPSECSIEKDPRILNPKQDLTWLILDEQKNKNIIY